MPVNKIAILIDCFSFKDERSRLDKVLLISVPGAENLISFLISHNQFNPRLNNIHGASREVVTYLVVGDQRLNRYFLTGRHFFWYDEFQRNCRTGAPLILNFRDLVFTLKPFFS